MFSLVILISSLCSHIFFFNAYVAVRVSGKSARAQVSSLVH